MGGAKNETGSEGYGFYRPRKFTRLALWLPRVLFVALLMQLGPISWSFNKNSLAGSGYSIEPEKVVRLPEGASAAFSASFQAR